MRSFLTSFSRSIFAWPLIQRELLTLLRTSRAFWLLVLSVAFSGVLPLFSWPKDQGSFVFFDQNIFVFLIFVMTQLALALLIVPAFTAGAIAGERQSGTYDLLYSTLLKPSGVIISKILAAMTYTLLLLLVSAPGASLLFLLGGLDFEAVLRCYAVIFSSVVMSGLVCLTVSMRSERTTPAAVRSYVWVAFWSGGLCLLLILLHAVYRFNSRAGMGGTFGGLRFQDLIVATSPFATISTIVEPVPLSRTASVPSWILHIAYCGVVGSLHFVYLLRRARLPSWATERSTPRAHIDLHTGKPERKHPVAWTARWLLRATKHSEPRGALAAFGNPVLRRELLCEFAGGRRFRRVLFWLPLSVCVLTGIAGRWDADMIIALMICTLLFQMLIVPAVAATSVTREREQENLDLLRGTRLSMRSIVHGKVLAAFLAGIGPIVAVGFFGLVLLRLGGELTRTDDLYASHLTRNVSVVWTLSKLLFVLGLTTLFLAATGVFFSVVSRTSLSALVKTYAALVVLFLFLPLLVAISGGEDILAGISPVGTMVAVYASALDVEPDSKMAYAIYFFTIIYGSGILLTWGLAAGSFDQQSRDL